MFSLCICQVEFVVVFCPNVVVQCFDGLLLTKYTSHFRTIAQSKDHFAALDRFVFELVKEGLFQKLNHLNVMRI